MDMEHFTSLLDGYPVEIKDARHKHEWGGGGVCLVEGRCLTVIDIQINIPARTHEIYLICFRHDRFSPFYSSEAVQGVTMIEQKSGDVWTTALCGESRLEYVRAHSCLLGYGLNDHNVKIWRLLQ